MIKLKDFVKLFEYDNLIVTDNKDNVLLKGFKEDLTTVLDNNKTLSNSKVIQCFTVYSTIYITIE